MYRSFYKFESIPFRLTPDPRFFYASESHERGLAYLHYALQQRAGFVVVTGDPGTGKTELISRLASEVSSNSGINIKIMSAHSKKENLLDRIFTLFLNRAVSNFLDQEEKFKALELFLVKEMRQQIHALLVIDEANNLSIDSFSILSQLASLRVDDKPLLQCFLFGQQPLLSKLELPKLQSLQQQILIYTQLENLDLSDTRRYIEHRLTCSGWHNDPSFDDKVFTQIHQFTQGIPRTINALCSRILVECCLDQKHRVDSDTTSRIIQEMQAETILPRQSLDLDFSQYGKTESVPVKKHTSVEVTQASKKGVHALKKELVTSDVAGKSVSDDLEPGVSDRKLDSAGELKATGNEDRISSPSKTAQQDKPASKLKWGEMKKSEQTQYIHGSFIPSHSDHNKIIQQASEKLQSIITNKAESSPAEHRSEAIRKTRRRESGLLDKDLRALASVFEKPIQTEKNDIRQASQSNVFNTEGDEKEKSLDKRLIDAIVRQTPSLLKKIMKSMQRKFPFVNKWIGYFPISYSGLIISVSILIVFWLFIYGPGLNLTMSVLKYFASLAGH